MKKTVETNNEDNTNNENVDKLQYTSKFGTNHESNDNLQNSPKFFQPKKEEIEQVDNKLQFKFVEPENKKLKTIETQKGKEVKEYGKKSHFEFLKIMNENKDPIGVYSKNGGLRPITMEEVEQHYNEKSLWTVLNGKVYDLTSYLDYHPGGEKKLKLGAGSDCTSLFSIKHV